MKNSQIVLRGLAHALGVVAYVSLVAFMIFNGEHLFNNEPNFLIPVFMLLLFVVSALITSSLVLGMPIHLYLSNRKLDAFRLLSATTLWLVICIAIVLIVSLLTQ